MDLYKVVSDIYTEIEEPQKIRSKSGLYKKPNGSVKHPQSWPHLYLGSEYHTQEIHFYELNLAQFVAGETEIISRCSNTQEYTGRLKFLAALMYEAEHLHVNSVLQWYACWLREIELGYKQWGDDFRTVRYGIYRQQYLPPDELKKKDKKSRKKVLFCHRYQSGECPKAAQHWVRVQGAYQEVFHVCATCWLVRRV